MKFFINHLSYNRLNNHKPILCTLYDRPKSRAEEYIYWSRTTR